MIKEDYVSLEVAKLLKEKGMNKSCFKHYVQKNNNDGTSEAVTVCTLQMAMKWLREVHNLYTSVLMGFDVDNPQYYFFVPSVTKFTSTTGEYITPFDENEFDTYEEACEAAIKYCLKHLI